MPEPAPTTARDEALAAIAAHYATLEIGQRVMWPLAPGEDDVRAYAARTGIEYPGRYVAPDGGHLVPPGMIFFPPARAFGLTEGPPLARSGFFTAAQRAYGRAVRVGEAIRLEGTLANKFERGGYWYIVARWIAVDADGHEVASGEEEHTLGTARKPRDA